MRLTRIYVDEALASGEERDLPRSAAAHLGRVLRLGNGDPLTLFDGRGGEYAARIIAVTAGRMRVRVEEHTPVERESPLALVLAQSVSRGERMDWIVQKATELGVHTIAPVLTARGVVRLDERQAAAKHAHWRAVAIAAAEQCGRNRIPEICMPQSLHDWLAQPRDGARIVLGIDGTRPLAAAQVREQGAVLIGPEGGFAPEERELIERRGFECHGLGPRVLRTETAAIAALAVLQAACGHTPSIDPNH
jgi:16S rRNA (uracil1498-N3)-methyltransferase